MLLGLMDNMNIDVQININIMIFIKIFNNTGIKQSNVELKDFYLLIFIILLIRWM
jgi:hypothetical protein